MLSTTEYVFLFSVSFLGFTGFWRKHYGLLWDSFILALALTIFVTDLLMR